MIRCRAYNRFGVLMGASSLASCPRWPSLRGNSWPMITLFPSQGYFCATAKKEFTEQFYEGMEDLIRRIAAASRGFAKVTSIWRSEKAVLLSLMYLRLA